MSATLGPISQSENFFRGLCWELDFYPRKKQIILLIDSPVETILFHFPNFRGACSCKFLPCGDCQVHVQWTCVGRHVQEHPHRLTMHCTVHVHVQVQVPYIVHDLSPRRHAHMIAVRSFRDLRFLSQSARFVPINGSLDSGLSNVCDL